MSDNYPLAQEALKRGWAVFPCGPDKKPITPHGFKDATRDPQLVSRMFKARPRALVGIPCEINDIWALDCDVKNGVNGIAELQRLAKEHGAEDVSCGPMQSTPSDGLHLLFKMGAWDVPQSAGKIAPGIDVRSAGYICTGSLPDGRAYVWNSAEGHGMDAPLTEAPGWLLKLVGAYKFDTSPIDTEESQKPPTAPQGSINFWLEKYLPQATIGTRNATGFDLACQVRDAGSSQAETEALPYPERCPQGRDVYTRAEWLASVKSAYDRTPREPAKQQGQIIVADPPEPEPPPAPQEAQQSEPEQSLTDGWVDPWTDSARTLRDAYKPRPPIPYIVEGLLRSTGLYVVFGASGDLKSFLLQDLAICTAAGREWLPTAPWKVAGHSFATNQAPVFWLDFDNGPDTTDERFEALGRAYDLPPETPLTYYSMPTPWLNSGDERMIGDLINRINAAGAKLVVIDNLSVTKGKADEKSDDMTPVMSLLRRTAAATNAAILLIHHERKTTGLKTRQGENLRGHSSIEAALDLALRVEREGDIVTIRSTKTRWAEVAPFSAVFTFEHKPDSKELLSARFYGIPTANNEGTEAITDEIKSALADGFLNKTQLVAAVKKELPEAGVNLIRDLIDRLAAAGDLVTKPGKRTEVLYDLQRLTETYT